VCHDPKFMEQDREIDSTEKGKFASVLKWAEKNLQEKRYGP